MTTKCIPAFQKLILNILIKVILSNGYMLGIFRKSVGKIPVSLKSDKNYGHFTYRLMYICDIVYITEKFFSFFLSFFFFENCAIYDMWEKYFIAGQVTNINIAHAHCTLDT